MNKTPDVSIIMAVFNGEEFIEDSIKSVLKQTFKNFEFIIVDDGSIDNSLKIIKSYQAIDSRIKIITQKNNGLAKSLNVGIKNSKGKYIARIDADDLCYECRLEKQYLFMENNHLVDLIGSSVDVINENGVITSQKIQITEFKKSIKIDFYYLLFFTLLSLVKESF